MKKIILFLLILILLPLTTNAQTFDSNLYFGLRNNPDVEKLQEFLTDQGIYNGPITGNFFSLTLAALKKYQSQNNITPAAGFFGPLTRAKVNDILSVQLNASNQQAVTETGTTTPLTTQNPTTETNQLVQNLQNQILVLQQQLTQLQQQNQTIQNQQTQIQSQQTQIQQNQQNQINSIQQPTNQQTTPPRSVSQIPAPPQSATIQSTPVLPLYLYGIKTSIRGADSNGVVTIPFLTVSNPTVTFTSGLTFISGGATLGCEMMGMGSMTQEYGNCGSYNLNISLYINGSLVKTTQGNIIMHGSGGLGAVPDITYSGFQIDTIYNYKVIYSISGYQDITTTGSFKAIIDPVTQIPFDQNKLSIGFGGGVEPTETSLWIKYDRVALPNNTIYKTIANAYINGNPADVRNSGNDIDLIAIYFHPLTASTTYQYKADLAVTDVNGSIINIEKSGAFTTPANGYLVYYNQNNQIECRALYDGSKKKVLNSLVDSCP